MPLIKEKPKNSRQVFATPGPYDAREKEINQLSENDHRWNKCLYLSPHGCIHRQGRTISMPLTTIRLRIFRWRFSGTPESHKNNIYSIFFRVSIILSDYLHFAYLVELRPLSFRNYQLSSYLEAFLLWQFSISKVFSIFANKFDFLYESL